MMSPNRLMTLAIVGLLAAACAGPPTYATGDYQSLSAHDAEIAYISKNLQPTDSSIVLDQPIRAIRAPMPDYPAEIRAAKQQGIVIVQFTIEPDGSVGNLHRIQTPSPDLLKLTLSAVSQWKFQPLTRNGQPVSVVVNMPFNFIVK